MKPWSLASINGRNNAISYPNSAESPAVWLSGNQIDDKQLKHSKHLTPTLHLSLHHPPEKGFPTTKTRAKQQKHSQDAHMYANATGLQCVRTTNDGDFDDADDDDSAFLILIKKKFKTSMQNYHSVLRSVRLILKR